MPAESEDQRQAAAVALAAKRGEKDVRELQGAAKDMYESMSESELEDYAEKEGSINLDKTVKQNVQKFLDNAN